jgi:hypothetical protein
LAGFSVLLIDACSDADCMELQTAIVAYNKGISCIAYCRCWVSTVSPVWYICIAGDTYCRCCVLACGVGVLQVLCTAGVAYCVWQVLRITGLAYCVWQVLRIIGVVYWPCGLLQGFRIAVSISCQ